ncbi:MAG: hypothetical protein EBZ48_03965 [Proteobacteria bacterium]|nr:hypothetical protein [Pseudomonadota bacterium]
MDSAHIVIRVLCLRPRDQPLTRRNTIEKLENGCAQKSFPEYAQVLKQIALRFAPKMIWLGATL